MKILYNKKFVFKNFVLGAFFAFSGCFLTMHGMENDKNLKRQAPEDLDVSKKAKTDFIIDESVLHDLLPKWQDVARSASRGELTSEMLENYVRGRIDIRIAYWKKQYENLQRGDKADVALDEIPVYAIFDKNSTSYDLVHKIFVFSDAGGKEVYEASNTSSDAYSEMIKKTLGCFTGDKCIYVRDYGDCLERQAYQILDTIEHEITHAEQWQNAAVISKHYGTGVNSLTNKDAHVYCGEAMAREISGLNLSPSVTKSTSQSMESEADLCMIKFHPNLHCFAVSCQTHKTFLGTDYDERGYTSLEKCAELTQKYYQERPWGEGLLDFMNHTKEDVFVLEQGKKRVKERFEKMGLSV